MIMIFNRSRFMTSNKYYLAVDFISYHPLLSLFIFPFQSFPFILCPQCDVPPPSLCLIFCPLLTLFPPFSPFSYPLPTLFPLFTVNLVRRGQLTTTQTFSLANFSHLSTSHLSALSLFKVSAYFLSLFSPT